MLTSNRNCNRLNGLAKQTCISNLLTICSSRPTEVICLYTAAVYNGTWDN